MSQHRPTPEELALAALAIKRDRIVGPESLSEAERRELAELEIVVGELGLAAEPAEPPNGLRDRLLENLAGLPESRQEVKLDEDGVLIASTEEMPWKPHRYPGIEIKTLFVDSDAGMATRLYRMSPGSVFPPHRHGGVEELFILSGEVQVHGQRMGPGDYCRAEFDTIHRATKSAQGAVVLVRTSIHNEPLDS